MPDYDLNARLPFCIAPGLHSLGAFSVIGDPPRAQAARDFCYVGKAFGRR